MKKPLLWTNDIQKIIEQNMPHSPVSAGTAAYEIQKAINAAIDHDEIVTGSVVQLNSGSVNMTVTKKVSDAGLVEVSFFAEGEIRTMTLSKRSLTLVETQEEEPARKLPVLEMSEPAGSKK